MTDKNGNVVGFEAEEPRGLLDSKPSGESGQIQELNTIPFVAEPDDGGEFSRG